MCRLTSAVINICLQQELGFCFISPNSCIEGWRMNLNCNYNIFAVVYQNVREHLIPLNCNFHGIQSGSGYYVSMVTECRDRSGMNMRTQILEDFSSYFFSFFNLFWTQKQASPCKTLNKNDLLVTNWVKSHDQQADVSV